MELYEKLCGEISEDKKDVFEAMLHAVKITTNLSIKNIMQNHPFSKDLLRLMAMLPGGIL